jgi:hypothetical protein
MNSTLLMVAAVRVAGATRSVASETLLSAAFLKLIADLPNWSRWMTLEASYGAALT